MVGNSNFGKLWKTKLKAKACKEMWNFGAILLFIVQSRQFCKFHEKSWHRTIQLIRREMAISPMNSGWSKTQEKCLRLSFINASEFCLTRKLVLSSRFALAVSGLLPGYHSPLALKFQFHCSAEIYFFSRCGEIVRLKLTFTHELEWTWQWNFVSLWTIYL